MTKTNLNLFTKNLILLISIFSTTTLSAKMAKRLSYELSPVPYQLPIGDLISYLQTQKPTPNESPSKLDWALFAKNVFEVEKIETYSQIKPSEVTIVQIAEGINLKIYSLDWKSLGDAKIKKLKEWEQPLANYISANTLNWAWVQFQIGKKLSSKKTLKSLFEAEFDRLMKLKVVSRRFGGGPMDSITKIESALLTLSDKEERSNLRKKIKQVQVHLANLPDSHVMT